MTKIGPKETALKSKRAEIAEGIPDFLDASKRAAKTKTKAKPDGDPGVTLAPPLAVQKAIERDLSEPSIPIAELHNHPAATPNRESWDKIPAVKKAKEKKPPRALQKALAEKDKLNQPKHSAKANPMESKVKKPTDKKQTKLEMIVGLLRRKQGCTTADVLKATGWPAVSMPAQAKAAGLKLKKEKTGKCTTYKIA